METLPHPDSRRLYSWWWDSHISPKNSKWLQENLADMDAKIKTMIRLIEEDADSFARRAEMYYKKRPELMKLVEEFYRAYRALAERYDHATGELRHAHRTMAAAFPNQVPFEMAEDSPSGSSADKQEPHTPEMPHPIRSLLDPDDSHKVAWDLTSSGLHSLKVNGSYSGESDAGFGIKSSKQLNEMLKIKEEREQNLASEVLQLSDERQNLKDQVISESNRAGRAETEIHNLKKALADMHCEKEAILLQYQQSTEKLSNLEGEINLAQMNSQGLDEQARKAAIEVQTLKESLFNLEAERAAGFLQHKKLLEKISNLESTISKAQEDARGLDERAIRAEIQARYLEKDLSRLESEKDAGHHQYKECLKRISDLEKKLSLAQEEVRLLAEKADRAGTEVWKLKRALADLNEEKEAAAFQYEQRLKKISKLESELFCAEEDIRQLNSAVLMETAKLKSAEERCVLLETSNRSLQLEADNLVKRIGMKDLELSKRHEELEKLQDFVRDEHLQFALVESTLQTLQNLHFQSQADQRSLAMELKNGLQILKGLETCKHGLDEEIQKVKDENQILDELNSSSAISMENLKGEILSLRKMKEKLEEEVGLQISQTNSLQQEIYHLKEEINSLNKRYQALMEQVESVGLNPECIGSSVKELMNENTNLRQICKERDEKEVLFKKLDDLEHRLDKNASLEMSLSNLHGELDGSRDKVEALQESCQLLCGEKSALVAEKAILLSQLQIITETMQKLLEKNFILENSLSGANAELEGLRAKSNSLEELCKVLNNEKSNLLCERTTLVVQLNNVEQRLQSLEKRFAELEQKHAGLEKENESTLSQVAELKVSLDVEKQKRENFTLSSGPRLASLENHTQSLQEETRWRKKEFEELDKAANAQFEIFILRKFIQDMEQKNYSLLIEYEKHVEASELTEKLISELEGENLEQQVEAELLLDEIEKLRLGIYKVLGALDIGPDIELDDKIGNDQIFVQHIIENIGAMKCSLWNYEDARQQLLVENSILLTLVGQLRFEGMEIVSEKKILDQEFKTITKQLAMVQKEEHELLQLNGQLKSEVNEGEQRVGALKAEMEKLCAHQGDLQRAYFNLQLEYSQVLEENSYLLKNLSDLKEKNYMVEDESDLILLEALALDNLAMIFKNFVTEKTVELELLSDDLHKLHGVNRDLAKEVVVLRGKLEMQETEHLLFKDLVKKSEEEVHYVRDFSNHLRQEVLTGKDLLCQKETELSVVEQNLKSTGVLNSELCRTVEGLKMQHEESMLVKENLEKHILGLSEVNMHQNKEIECLREVNRNLESQLHMLHKEIEEHRIREENLSSELQEMSNEFEIWEAEAATFHFDLQISNIREVLFENKVHELTAVCESLANESSSKTVMIEEMKERVVLMESEIGGLKAQFHAFTPAIKCPRDNALSLEPNIHSRPEFNVADSQESKDVELAVHEKSGQVLMEDHNSVIPNRIPELQDLQARISAVERVVTEEMKRLAVQESSNIKLENALRQMEELKSNYGFSLRKYEQNEETELGDELSNYPKLKKKNPEIFLVRNGILMKEFPLDHISASSMHGRSRRGHRRSDNQVLELWETSGEDCSLDCTFIGETKDPFSPLQAEKELGVDKLAVSTSFSKPNQDQNKREILERLGSDAQKLKSLQTTVEDLRRKLETNENKKKRAKNVDIEIVKEQLKEVEETIVQLVEVNGRLSKHVESSNGKASPELEDAENVRRKRVTEQARKGSEKLRRLLLEVQRIEYGLLKMEDEKTSRRKNRFSRSRTSVILKNFIYSGRRGNPRHKKACLCGCFRPPTNGEGNMFS